MEVHKFPVLKVFEAKERLEVPLFQRQYVWNEEHQWFPLWEDIERKFSDSLDGRDDRPNHFLGTIVLDQKHTPTGHVAVRHIIDGQQRLTTLQIFLSCYRDFCMENRCSALAEECNKFIINTGMMADPDIDRFKVWPTQLDRAQFRDVITSNSREELERRHPLRRKPYARKFEPRPRMVEAYFFFAAQLRRFFLGDGEGMPPAHSIDLESRLDKRFQALRNTLMIVVIDLQQDDDPQVIFETLNARGEPLLPADLLRNFIFLRAGRAGLDTEAAYKEYWADFDDEFWRKEVKQGRLTRPRSDLFMQHFLASQQGQDIPIKHLYVEYRHWLETSKPFPSVKEELEAFSRQGRHFRRIIEPKCDDAVYHLSKFLEIYDIRTAYPLILFLLDANISQSEWIKVTNILESYLLRRAVCNMDTKNYNRIFLNLTRTLRRDGFSVERLRDMLLAQTGESSIWPDDAIFREAWLRKPLYAPHGPLNNPKLVYIFERLNQTFMSPKSESIVFNRTPTIEHIMPQQWIENWPLPDGSRGMQTLELMEAPDTDPRALATRSRRELIHTLGNLTILSLSLNAAQSNLPWDKKKIEIMRHSLLPINQRLLDNIVWDEEMILRRGADLCARAVDIWSK